MTIVQAVRTIFLVVVSTLGFASAYAQIETGTRQHIARARTLSRIQYIFPLILYISLVLMLLRYIYGSTSGDIYWVFVNIQTTIMIYSNLLVPNLAGFIIIQAVGALMYTSVGAMNLASWLFFFAASFAIYAERWYGPKIQQHKAFYIVPALIVGALFWVVMAVRFPASITRVGALVNYIAFAWAYLAVWDFDHYLQRDQQVLAKLTHEVQYDGLTRARNWSTFRTDLNRHYENRDSQPLVLVTIDIDHFKRINDTYGHLAGNQALIMISRQLKNYLKTESCTYKFYRTGGEEFAIILPTTSLDHARTAVTACQDTLRQMALPFGNGELTITASFGLAIANKHDNSSTSLFKRADHYLYQSKRNGRNCATVEGQILDY